MKIAITADIHHAPGFTSKATIQSMMNSVLSKEPDLIVVAGDIGETRISTDLFCDGLKAITDACDGINVAALLGNHDIWSKNGNPDSLELWETILPQIIKNQNVLYLEEKNLVQDGVAIVGSYLHYDYSAQDPEGLAVNFIKHSFPDWTMDEYYERMKKHSNNDGHFLIGLPSDREFAAQIGEKFRQRLLDAEVDVDIHSIVIVTHVPCMPSQITRNPYNKGWSMGTPYFGNLSYSELILEMEKVKHVVSGHSHNKEYSVVTFNDGHKVPVQVIEAEYGDPQAIMVEV